MFSFAFKKLKRSDQTSIEDLPDEILHKILVVLDRNSIKNCSAVNKRFASIVATSSVMLKSFKLKLTGNFWQSTVKISEVASVKRKLQCVEISNVDGCHDGLVKIFKNSGRNFKSLTLSDSRIDDFTLKEMLRYADSLETLVLSEVVIIKKLPAINSVSMRRLKNLTIDHCDWNIIMFIKAQLESLSLKSYLDEGQKTNLVTFLCQQYQLKDLSLRGTSMKNLFQQDDIIANCNFSLQKFHLEHFLGKNSDNVNWHVTEFLGLHVGTLTNVEISGPHCEHLNGFAIANLENLESLSIDVRGLPKNEEFYEIIVREPNDRLKELSLRGFFIHQELIKKILLKYPSIEKLELNEWGGNGTVLPEMLDFISKNLLNLQKLSIGEISNGTNVKFAALKNLSVTLIRNTGKLVQFIMHNSSVDTLKVNLVYFEQITSNFIEQLRDLDNIKHLAFGGNGKALKTILDLMKKNQAGTLKSLELSLMSDESSTVQSTKCKKFYFPIDNGTKFDVI